MDTKQLERSIENLLPRVQEKLDRSREIAKLRNENFNIFSVLRKEHDEEHLHSAFIAELLNPQGGHDQGDMFLTAFLDEIGYNEFTASSEVAVYTEKTFEGGRLDILLKNGNFNLVIENKIWAEDQLGQLARYQKYIQNNGGKGRILYLTLFGTEASKPSREHANLIVGENEYSCISYHSDIVKWLERCFQLAADHPPLRETIKQYLNLVKKLTGQLTNTKMTEEIEKLLCEKSEAAWYIANNWPLIHSQKVIEFLQELKTKVEEQLRGSWSVEVVIPKSKYPFPSFSLKNKNWKNISICLEGQQSFTNHPTVFGLIADEDKIDRVSINKLLETNGINLGNWQTNSRWPIYMYIFDFSKQEDSKKLYEEKAKFCEELANKIIDMALSLQEPLKNISF